MRQLILISLLFSSVSFAAKAELISDFSVVLNNCNQLTHAQWIRRYSDIEDQVIEALEKNPKLSLAKDKELFEVVFPQDLPEEHGMSGAFLGCFEIFHEYQKAINNVQSMSALKRLEACYQDAYKIDPPPILGRFMDCLRRVKY